jgi:DNA primase
MVNRIAHRLQVKEETVWKRLKELRATRKGALTPGPSPKGRGENTEAELPSVQSAKPLPHERELVELLLAEPAFVGLAVVELPSEEVEHPGLRKVIEALYRLHAEGQPADLDHLHGRIDNERLWDRVLILHENGLDYPDRPHVFQKVLERFRERAEGRRKHAILNQLQDASDEATKLALLKQLRDSKKTGKVV